MEFDSKEWREARNQQFAEWFPDPHALQVIQVLMNACELWDDLTDKDKPIESCLVDHTFRGVFVDLTVNPFWQRTRTFIEPIIIVAINAWQDANDLEQSESVKERNLAFHIRNFTTELLPAIAFCMGGYDYMRSISKDMRLFFAHESFEQWEHRK